jgi:hypothetical protein
VLVKELVRLDVQRGRGRVPDDLVDADYLAARVPTRDGVAQADEEDVLTVDRDSG